MEEISHICRVCLRQNLKKFKSLSENLSTSPISTHIAGLTSIRIDTGDNWPDKICLYCFKQLKIAIDFVQKCKISHDALISLFVKAEVKESSEESCNEFLDDTVNFIEEKVKHEPSVEINIKQAEQEIHAKEIVYDKFQCNECGDIFKSKCKMRVHWNRVHLPQQLTCPLCSKKFGNFIKLNIHKAIKPKYCFELSQARIERDGKAKTFYCRLCPYKNKEGRRFRVHYRTHTGERPYTCEICGGSFTQISCLRYHKELVHNMSFGEGACHICGKFFKAKIFLSRHIYSHKKTRVDCPVCKKTYSSKSALTLHMDSHTSNETFTCDICSYKTISQNRLDRHKQDVHPAVLHTCEFCGFRSHRKYHMRKHQKKHATANFACSKCGKFLHTEKKLKNHLQKAHHAPQYTCHLCSKMYIKKETLRNHLKRKHDIKQEPPVQQDKTDKNQQKESKNVKSEKIKG